MSLRDQIEALPDTFGDEREYRGETLREVGTRIGIPFADLSRFENRKTDVKVSTLLKIIDYVDDRP